MKEKINNIEKKAKQEIVSIRKQARIKRDKSKIFRKKRGINNYTKRYGKLIFRRKTCYWRFSK